MFAVLVAVAGVFGVIYLVSLLPVSDESKWRILFGLGVVSLFIGYLFLRRAPPIKKQTTALIDRPTTPSCGDVRNGSSEIDKKLCHTPNIPSTAINTNSTPSKVKIIPPNCLFMFTSFHHFFSFLCYNVLAYVGGEGFEPSWLVADGCQDRYVCQFHHPPTTENWGECFRQDAAPPQPSQLNCKSCILLCQLICGKTYTVLSI